MAYSVRPAEPAEARDDLLPLWTANLAFDADPDDKLRWFYKDSPHGPGRAFLLEGEPAAPAVGCAGIGTRNLYYRGELLRVALFADLAVERAHRTAFPALALLRAVKHEVSSSFDLGYGFPNAKAVQMYRRAGYVELGAMPRYVRVLRSAPYVARYVRRPMLARAMSTVIDRSNSLVLRWRERTAVDGFSLEWLPDVDSRFDELWSESRDAYPIICERSAAFLRWRFGRQPGKHYRICTLVAKGTRRVRAYAIVHDGGGVAHIVDMLAPGPRELDMLLRSLAPALASRGLHAIAIRFLGTPKVLDVLAAHAFIARKHEPRSIVVTLPEARASDRELLDPQLWYFTDLDEDW